MTDYATELTADTVRLERLLPGPIERIWAYLTESEKRQTWLARGPMDMHKDGKFELTWENDKLSKNDPTPERWSAHKSHTIAGRVLACEPPRLLSFEWGGPTNSFVTFELEPKGDRVQLVVTHSRLSGRDGKVSVSGGWHAHLALLEDLLDGREKRKFWENLTVLNKEYEARL